MNISFEKVDNVNALLTVNIDKADCQENVDKMLKNYRKNANVPGFRKGMVPMSLIKRQYEKAILAEEVDKLMQDKVNEYIRENKVNMLGMPLPNEEKMKPVDFDTQDSFEFVFDIALAPEFKIELDEKDSIPYYHVEVSEDMINRQVDMYRDRAGKYEKFEQYQDNDMLKGLLVELDENGNAKEGGLQVESAVMMPTYMKNEEQKAIFANAKLNDVLTFNPAVAYDNNEAELASLLKIKKEEVEAHKGNYTYQVEEIQRHVPAELNQTLFDVVFGEGAVKSEEEFRNRIKENMENQLREDSDFRFIVDVRDYAMKKVGELTYPEATLKRVMMANNRDKGADYVEKNFEGSLKELTWHLIKEQLVEANGIKVNDDDVKAMARQTTLAQFAQYGMGSVPEDLLDKYVKQTLEKPENVENMISRVIENKLGETLKGKVSLDNKTISLDEFNKLFQ